MRLTDEIEAAVTAGNSSKVRKLLNIFWRTCNTGGKGRPQKKPHVRTLDDITSEHSNFRRLGEIFSVPSGNGLKFRRSLAATNVFSEDLEDPQYGRRDQEYAAKHALYNRLGSLSYYFKQVTDPDVLERNRRVLAGTHTFRRYLQEQGVTSLDDIKQDPHASASLGTLLGSKRGNPNALRKRLVALRAYSAQMSACTQRVREYIARSVISGEARDSFYFTEVGSAIIEENRQALVHTKAFRRYLQQQKVQSLDDITEDMTSQRMSTLFGFKPHRPKEFRRQLVRYNTFSDHLGTYTPNDREYIAEQILDRLKSSVKDVQVSYYFSEVDQPTLEDNRDLLLQTKAVQTFLANEGVNLADLASTLTTPLTQSFFRRYFDVEKQSPPLTGKIVAPWSSDEEQRLTNLVQAYATPKEFGIDLYGDFRPYWETGFGRSASAIRKKAGALRLIPTLTGTGNGGGTKKIVYPFPPIHEQECGGLTMLFPLLAKALQHGDSPDFVPVLTFESVGHGRYIHATLPIHYQGPKLAHYNAEEQETMKLALLYLTQGASFREQSNGSREAPPHWHTLADTLGKPSVIQLKRGTESFVQLLVPHREEIDGKQTPQLITLPTNGPVYLHYHHQDQISYDDVRGTPKVQT
ncbi:MAG: hypothetical protein Q7R76_01370 [Candidatus Woesearchaeota archaeon]|nr:hypothetical protein [Candidatus Woesearchaeota archaeon]